MKAYMQREVSVKFIFVLLFMLLVSCFQPVHAREASLFEIPRSNVVDLVDPVSGRTYPLFIKLPKSYQSNKDKLYPVIYLTDAWYSFQIVSGSTRFPMNTGKMKEAIIVGISYSKGSRGPSSRIRDYTPTSDPSWKLQTGEAEQHATFIEKTVFPYIKSSYRVDTLNRTYVGNSLGGLFGAYILFNKAKMFKNYILGSPSVWFKNNDILSVNAKMSHGEHKVFVAVGAEETPKFSASKHDMVLGAKSLMAKISHTNFPETEVRFLEIQGANHDTAFPTTAIQGLYWLLKNDSSAR